MSVIGFDIGNESCVIASAKRRGVDVLVNDESKRETPAVVSFGKKQRFFGSAGAAFTTSNPKSTISQIKRLIGKVYKEVEEELKLLPFVTSEGPRGGILIELEYLKIKRSFTPVEILGMLFKHLKQIAEKNLESSVADCVIGIPSYYTDLQRRLYLDAAQIAGLKPLRLMHDGTAIALSYGMYKTDFFNSGPTYVMFVDIGHCDTQVTVAAFQQTEMKILSHSFDQNLGGRDFDEVLFKHFAVRFNEKHKIDIFSNARASVRLRASCEKVKKVLSVNAEAPLSIECLVGDTDVKGIITRKEFENLSSKLLQRVIDSCNVALTDSGLSSEKLYTIELVGSGSRIPAITGYLNTFFNKEPARTLNASECVARGCALRCAMFSPNLLVRDYKITDSFPYSIGIASSKKEVVVFPRGSPFPNEKIMKRNGNTSFDVQIAYIKERDYRIGPPERSDAEKVKVGYNMKLNEHGIIEIDSATIPEVKSHCGWMAASNHYLPKSNHQTLNLQVSKNLDVSTTDDELVEAKKKEKTLMEHDINVEEAKDQRNALESFVYDTRSKLSGAYRSYATDSEKEDITNKLQETEDWLNEDSDDESEQDYTGRLKDLEKLLEPIKNMYYEGNARAKATKSLQTCIEEYRLLADSKPDHQKEKVKKTCLEAEQWLNSRPPNTFSTHIDRYKEDFERDCKNIIRPISLSPGHKEPGSYQRYQRVEPDQKDQRDFQYARGKAQNPLQTAHYSSPAESLPADKNEKWIYPQHHTYVRRFAAGVNHFVRNFQSDCEEPKESNEIDQRVHSDQWGQPVDSDITIQPMDTDQVDQPIWRDQPMETDQLDQHNGMHISY